MKINKIWLSIAVCTMLILSLQANAQDGKMTRQDTIPVKSNFNDTMKMGLNGRKMSDTIGMDMDRRMRMNDTVGMNMNLGMRMRDTIGMDINQKRMWDSARMGMNRKMEDNQKRMDNNQRRMNDSMRTMSNKSRTNDTMKLQKNSNLNEQRSDANMYNGANGNNGNGANNGNNGVQYPSNNLPRVAKAKAKKVVRKDCTPSRHRVMQNK